MMRSALRYAHTVRAPILLTLLPLLGACASSTPRHGNVQSFSRAVFDAVTHKDRDALVAMLPPSRELLSACPGATKEHLDVLLAQVQSDLYADHAACAEVDWTGARIVRVEGGGIDSSPQECKGVAKVEDITIAITVGDREHVIDIDDGAFIAGGYYLADGLRCRAPSDTSHEHPAVGVAERAADQVCACRDSDCAMRATQVFAEEMQVAATTGGRITDEVTERVGAATQRMSDCMAKLEEPAPTTP